MPLAHPLGANFKEYIGSLTYRRGNWEFFGQLNFSQTGLDSSSTNNMGQDIFKSYTTRPYEYGHYTGQGLKRNMVNGHLKISYFLIPAMNLRLELGYMQRSINMPGIYQLENPYVYVGLKTSFWNVYRDF